MEREKFEDAFSRLNTEFFYVPVYIGNTKIHVSGYTLGTDDTVYLIREHRIIAETKMQDIVRVG